MPDINSLPQAIARIEELSRELSTAREQISALTTQVGEVRSDLATTSDALAAEKANHEKTKSSAREAETVLHAQIAEKDKDLATAAEHLATVETAAAQTLADAHVKAAQDLAQARASGEARIAEIEAAKVQELRDAQTKAVEAKARALDEVRSITAAAEVARIEANRQAFAISEQLSTEKAARARTEAELESVVSSRSAFALEVTRLGAALNKAHVDAAVFGEKLTSTETQLVQARAALADSGKPVPFADTAEIKTVTRYQTVDQTEHKTPADAHRHIAERALIDAGVPLQHAKGMIDRPAKIVAALTAYTTALSPKSKGTET